MEPEPEHDPLTDLRAYIFANLARSYAVEAGGGSVGFDLVRPAEGEEIADRPLVRAFGRPDTITGG